MSEIHFEFEFETTGGLFSINPKLFLRYIIYKLLIIFTFQGVLNVY